MDKDWAVVIIIAAFAVPVLTYSYGVDVGKEISVKTCQSQPGETLAYTVQRMDRTDCYYVSDTLTGLAKSKRKAT